MKAESKAANNPQTLEDYHPFNLIKWMIDFLLNQIEFMPLSSNKRVASAEFNFIWEVVLRKVVFHMENDFSFEPFSYDTLRKRIYRLKKKKAAFDSD